MQKYVVKVKCPVKTTCMYSKKEIQQGEGCYEVFDGNKIFYITKEVYTKLVWEFKKKGFMFEKPKEKINKIIIKDVDVNVIKKILDELGWSYEIEPY